MKRPGIHFRNLLALILTMTSLQVMAAATQTAGRDFNHDATGFPLKGGHATTACETCHVAGVFKGTPKTCDSCHALGKRIAATPKPTNHFVTDAQCDTCHFNTSTFLDARYNHGIATPGQCVTCHNSRIATGRPSSHKSGLMLTDSCDSCHRSFSWLPTGFNHANITPHSCDNAGCHVQGSNQFFRSSATHTMVGMATYYCDECHNVTSWSNANFIHDRASPSGVCMGCHDGVTATGKGTTHAVTMADCNTCHMNTVSWLGASFHTGAIAGICGTCHNGTNGVKGTVNDPNGTHIPLTAGGNPNCDLCHTSTTTFTVFSMNHSGITTCDTCHSSTSPYVVTTKIVLGNHQGSTASQDCSNCHSSTSSWTGALGTLPANHVTFTAGTPCTACHTGSTVATGAALHAFLSQTACNSCHYTGMVVYAPNHPPQQSSHKGNVTCSSSSCHAPLGREGTAYINWGG